MIIKLKHNRLDKIKQVNHHLVVVIAAMKGMLSMLTTLNLKKLLTKVPEVSSKIIINFEIINF